MTRPTELRRSRSTGTVDIQVQHAITEHMMRHPTYSVKLKFAREMTRSTFKSNYWTDEMATIVVEANSKRRPQVDHEVQCATAKWLQIDADAAAKRAVAKAKAREKRSENESHQAWLRAA